MPHPRTSTGPRAARPTRAALLVVLTLLLTVGLAGPAAAHASLVGSDPADGATLAAAPARITLTFDDALEAFEPVVTLTGPDGNQYQSGAAVIDGVTLSTAIQPLPAAGTYTIAYRVVSDDGHPVEGQLRFDLAAPASSPSSSPSSSPGPTSGPAATSTAPASATGGGTGGPATGSTSPPASSATTSPSPSGTETATETATAPASSSGGWSAWQWLAVALFAVLGFGVAMIVRRRLAGRATGGPDSDEPGR